MGGRPRNAEATKAAIVAAARLGFAANGFERTTIRSVAADAGVDPALIPYYFGSKDGLFAEAARFELGDLDLSGIPADRLADAILPVFLEKWAPDGPFLGMLRAAATNEVAAEALRRVFAEQVAPALMAVAVDRPLERAALVGTQLIGLAVTRSMLAVPPLGAMTDEALIAALRPVLAHYLTAPLDAPFD